MTQAERLAANRAKLVEVSVIQDRVIELERQADALEDEADALLKDCEHTFEDGTSALKQRVYFGKIVKGPGHQMCQICRRLVD